ncbi:MAG: YraN family protein [Candidatus Dormibacteraeota bacterium]|nr:YraN family protein [Candidatus Dormibacteraeota bacterium]
MDGHRRAQLGSAAEAAAARFLEEAGLHILELDARLPGGQVDVVAMDGDCLVIVEVKARSSNAFGTPAEAVDRRKRARLARLAVGYARAHPGLGRRLRVDVVAIDLDGDGHPARIEHLPAIDMG